MKKSILLYVFISISTLLYSQTYIEIKGEVKDENNIPIPGANILLSATEGVITDFNGKFTIETNKPLPFSIEISSLGFETRQVIITDNEQFYTIVLKEETMGLHEVVISASRTPERIAFSPFSIEKLSLSDIQNTTSINFYSTLENLKGVDVNYSSMGFASVNTRGFASFGNSRFLQLVDGMDNAAPGLNFSVGNLVGLSELDVEDIEVLPGAASGLYGANAFNGILFMNSKNPFDYPGVSAYAKTGIISVSNFDSPEPYYDIGFRYAKKINDNIAVKLNATYNESKDWAATDDNMYGNFNGTHINAGQPDAVSKRGALPYAHNALNKYGDEIGFTLLGLLNSLRTDPTVGPLANSLLLNSDEFKNEYFGNDIIGMDGIDEKYLIGDGKARNAKVDFSFHYRPKDSNIEIINTNKIGTGDFIYQAVSRYALRDVVVRQHKLEIKSNDFFIRGYATLEDVGNSYDLLWTGVNINRSYATDFYQRYLLTYLANRIPGIPGVSIPNQVSTNAEAHAIARKEANKLIVTPDSEAFKTVFEKSTTTALYEGSKLIDNSSMYHIDYNYKFLDKIPFADTQIGGSYRSFNLSSDGKIFTDYMDNINLEEFGIYIQSIKKIWDDKIKLTGSIRYDGASNFESNFSPRASMVFSPNDNNHIRLSYQTGFRYPTVQNQYIGLEGPTFTLLGGVNDNFNRYISNAKSNNIANSNILKSLANIDFVNKAVNFKGVDIISNSWEATSVVAYNEARAVNPNVNPATFLKKAEVDEVEPEKVVNYELGYRGFILDIINVDASAYYNMYNNFIAYKYVSTPNYGDVSILNASQFNDATSDDFFIESSGNLPKSTLAIQNNDYQIYAIANNTDVEVTSFGFNLGLDSSVNENHFGANYSFNDFMFDQSRDLTFEAGFNTPKHRVKAYFNNNKIFENFGFGLNAKWNSEFLFESFFSSGIIPSRLNIDTQINYTDGSSTFKLGGVNILGVEYVSALGTGVIGAQYYISWSMNL